MAKYEVKTLGQFLSKVVLYMRYGYVHYAVREIPATKDIVEVDQKILAAYSITFHRTTRAIRRKKGLANVMYIRFQYTFILLATYGIHEAFDNIVSFDFHATPLHFRGYSLGIKQGKPRLIIAPTRYRAIRSQLQEIALHNQSKVTAYFQRISPFRFAGINQQKWKLFLEVNRRRKQAGSVRIEWDEAKRWKRNKAS
ncbi:MAG: hypothetical protein QNJ72_18190 [Pleurocapsa sp. MO_226.B13]|nr:hypothetical protein [Pleurocapsa sp. MO_226.B13]